MSIYFEHSKPNEKKMVFIWLHPCHNRASAQRLMNSWGNGKKQKQKAADHYRHWSSFAQIRAKNQNSSKNSFLPFLCRLSFDATTNAAPYTCVLHTAQTASHGWQHICYVLIGHGMSADKKQIYSCHIINRIAQIVDIKTINGLLVTTTMATGQDCLRGSQTHPTDVIPNWCDQPAMLRKPQSSWEKENEADTPNNERFRFNIGI